MQVHWVEVEEETDILGFNISTQRTKLNSIFQGLEQSLGTRQF